MDEEWHAVVRDHLRRRLADLDRALNDAECVAHAGDADVIDWLRAQRDALAVVVAQLGSRSRV